MTVSNASVLVTQANPNATDFPNERILTTDGTSNLTLIDNGPGPITLGTELNLQSLALYSEPGLVCYTGSSNFVNRAIASSSTVQVTNGDGIAGPISLQVIPYSTPQNVGINVNNISQGNAPILNLVAGNNTTISGVSSDNQINVTISSSAAGGTVGSVGVASTTGLTVSGSPITTNGVISIDLPSGASSGDFLTVTSTGPQTLGWTPGSGLGTVQSVGLTSSTGLNVGGSPITTAGTLTVDLPVGAVGQVLSVTQSSPTQIVNWIAAGGTGTVTSIGITTTSGLLLTGSPVTTSGSISIDLPPGGTAGQVLKIASTGPQLLGWTTVATGEGLLEGAWYLTGGSTAHAPSASTSDSAIFFGKGLGAASATGGNIGVGVNSLSLITTASQNIAIGWNCLEGLTDGTGNIAIGNNVLNLSDNSNVVAIGNNALASCTGGGSLVAVGNNALTANIDGGNNTAVGESALASNDHGQFNTAGGWTALTNCTSGNNNTGFGSQAMGGISTTSNCTGIGSQALTATSTGADNTAVGFNAGGSLSSGNENVFMGSGTYGANTTGTGLTFIGFEAGGVTTTPNNYNTAVGHESLTAVSSDNNTAIGAGSLGTLTTGTENTAVGQNSANNLLDGNNCVAIGRMTQISNTHGSGITTVGYESDVGADSLTNATALGYQASVSVSNAVVLGNGDCNVGIGTSSPTYGLHLGNPGVDFNPTVHFTQVGTTPTTPATNNAVLWVTGGVLKVLSNTDTYSGNVATANSAGSSKTTGTATLTAGTVTVTTAAIATGSLIFVTYIGASLTASGQLSTANIVAGTSFDIFSTNVLDANSVNWWIVNPS